jgi:hypothetical protein
MTPSASGQMSSPYQWPTVVALRSQLPNYRSSPQLSVPSDPSFSGAHRSCPASSDEGLCIFCPSYFFLDLCILKVVIDVLCTGFNFSSMYKKTYSVFCLSSTPPPVNT